jgi:hypothetical protein
MHEYFIAIYIEPAVINKTFLYTAIKMLKPGTISIYLNKNSRILRCLNIYHIKTSSAAAAAAAMVMLLSRKTYLLEMRCVNSKVSASRARIHQLCSHEFRRSEIYATLRAAIIMQPANYDANEARAFFSDEKKNVGRGLEGEEYYSHLPFPVSLDYVHVLFAVKLCLLLRERAAPDIRSFLLHKL